MRISDWSSDVCSSDLALPQDQMSSEQIEDVMSALSEMGVNIVENDEREGDGQESAEGEEEETSLDEGEASTTFTPTATKKETLDRTDDQIGRASCRESVCQYV